MTGNDKIEFNATKLWQFHCWWQEDMPTSPVIRTPLNLSGTPRALGKAQRRKAIGVLACSMDEAFKKLRDNHPNVRIEGVVLHDIPVHYIVDRPDVVAVANRLDGTHTPPAPTE